MTTAIYARISRDAEGHAEGTAAQVKKGTKLATDLWPDEPIVTFVDDNITAADPKVERPAFNEMIAAVRRGEIRHVVAAEQSRLTRQPSEWEDLTVTLAKAGIVEVQTYRQGAVAVAGSKLSGRIMAIVDAEEIERLKVRINDKLEVLAAEGRPPGGRSYGYRNELDADGRKVLVIDETEAEVARWAADRILAGWSLSSIARDLTERGAPTARGGKWVTQTVRSMLRSPTITGLRVFRGVVVGEGNWQPIIDRATWEAVGARLTGPTSVTSIDGRTRTVARQRRAARRYLLTGGMAVCGRCGVALVAQQRRSRGGGRQPSYLCHSGAGGCNGIGILADDFEGYVVAKVLEHLDSDAFRAALLAADSHGEERQAITSELSALDARRGEGARMWARGELDSTAWEAARSELDAMTLDLMARLDAAPAPVSSAVAGITLDDWKAMTLEERREVLGLVMTSVTVNRATAGTRSFDADRVTIEWR